jgi:hypothetical protein
VRCTPALTPSNGGPVALRLVGASGRSAAPAAAADLSPGDLRVAAIAAMPSLVVRSQQGASVRGDDVVPALRHDDVACAGEPEIASNMCGEVALSRGRRSLDDVEDRCRRKAPAGDEQIETSPASEAASADVNHSSQGDASARARCVAVATACKFCSGRVSSCTEARTS